MHSESEIFYVKKFDEDVPESLPAVKKNRWDRNKCKKNSGGPHDMQMSREYHFDYSVIGDDRERRMSWQDWECQKCGKKDVIRIS